MTAKGYYNKAVQFHRHPSPPGNVVSSCDAAGVVVGGVRYECSLLITPDKLQKWRPSSATDIQEKDLQTIADICSGKVASGSGEVANAESGFANIGGGVSDTGNEVANTGGRVANTGGKVASIGGGEVVLLGADGILPKPQWLAFFAARGMALETMNIKAACRTYSVLTTDARPSILALIIPRP